MRKVFVGADNAAIEAAQLGKAKTGQPFGRIKAVAIDLSAAPRLKAKVATTPAIEAELPLALIVARPASPVTFGIVALRVLDGKIV